jgi:outer membrane lipoprotein-sorting protein
MLLVSSKKLITLHNSKYLILLILVLFEPIVCKSQNVDSLIALNSIARGGYEALKSLQSISMEGKATLGNQDAQYKVYILRPNYIRIDLRGKSNELYQTFDGENAWTFNKNADPENIVEMSYQEKQRLVTEADIDGPLIDYKEKGHKVTVEGVEFTEGKKTFVILVEQSDGSRKRLYLDEKTHLVVKESTYRTVKGNSPLATTVIKAESIFEAYTNFSGFLLPKLITTFIDGKLISILKIEKVEINVVKSKEFFAKDKIKQN